MNCSGTAKRFPSPFLLPFASWITEKILTAAMPLQAPTVDGLTPRASVVPQQHPDDLEARRSLAGIWLEMGRLADAEPILRTLSSKPGTCGDRFTFGRLLVAARSRKEAAPFLLDANCAPKLDDEALLFLGRYLEEEGRPEECAQPGLRSRLDFLPPTSYFGRRPGRPTAQPENSSTCGALPGRASRNRAGKAVVSFRIGLRSR